MKRSAILIAFLVLTRLLAACSTKVENPDNDDDQETENKDPVVIQPINLHLPALPDVSKLEIDPLYRGFFLDTFALIESSHAMLAQLNEFFVLVNENKLARTGAISLEKDGILLKGKSWYDETTNGLYFCDGANKAFYITWTADHLHVHRDLKVKLPVSSIPMTDGLPATIEADIDNAKGALGVTYSGIKRDPATVKDTETSIAFHYDALQAADTTTYGGIYAELEEGKIPATAGRRIVGKLGATGGEALAHLNLSFLCQPFDEAGTPPAWCVNVTHDADSLEAVLTGIAERYESLKAIPVPRHQDMKLVDFPGDMACPAE